MREEIGFPNATVYLFLGVGVGVVVAGWADMWLAIGEAALALVCDGAPKTVGSVGLMLNGRPLL